MEHQVIKMNQQDQFNTIRLINYALNVLRNTYINDVDRRQIENLLEAALYNLSKP